MHQEASAAAAAAAKSLEPESALLPALIAVGLQQQRQGSESEDCAFLPHYTSENEANTKRILINANKIIIICEKRTIDQRSGLGPGKSTAAPASRGAEQSEIIRIAKLLSPSPSPEAWSRVIHCVCHS